MTLLELAAALKLQSIMSPSLEGWAQLEVAVVKLTEAAQALECLLKDDRIVGVIHKQISTLVEG